MSIKQNIYNSYKMNYKLYRKAGLITNVPPHFLAALHYRESSFRSTSPGPGGPMQFDPPLSDTSMKHLLKTYTNLEKSTIEKFIQKGQDNLFVALVLSGCFVQQKLKYQNLPPLTKTDTSEKNQSILMKGFELYNGTAYGSPWNSPYVVNLLSPEKKAMRIVGTYIDPNGKRKKVDVVDKRPGAYTVFRWLEAAFVHHF